MVRRFKNELEPAVSGGLTASTQALALRTISRRRLLDQYGVEPVCKVTVLQAPAGYGKTQCLMQWRAALAFRGLRSALVRLDRGDDDLWQFLSAMRAALELLGLHAPDLPPADNQDREAFCQTTLSLVANVLGTTQRPVVILIDDAHWICSEEARRSVEIIFRRTPDHVRFVLATRCKPMLSLARLAAAGQLARIPGQALLFTLEETLCGLQGRTSHQDAVEIQALTSGWPALIDIIVSDGDFPSVLSDLRRGIVHHAVAGFLDSVVSGIAPQPARDCVAAGAISECFNPMLAGLILGRGDVEALLDAAAQSGMPLLIREDTKALAYPMALRLWLLSKLGTESASLLALHDQCARWLSKHDRVQEASRHVLQGPLRDTEDFTLLDSLGLSPLWAFGPELIAAYSPPPGALSEFPRLAFAHGLACQLAGGEAAVRVPHLDAVEQQIAAAFDCVLRDTPISDSAIAAIHDLIPNTHAKPTSDDDSAELIQLFAAISAFDAGHDLQAESDALLAHDRLARRHRPFAAFMARLYCGFAALRAGRPLQALAHFRACVTLAITSSLGEHTQSRSRACVTLVLHRLIAAPAAMSLTRLRPPDDCLDSDSIPLSFAARVETSYRVFLLSGDRSDAKSILTRGVVRARAQGWRRVAVELECELLDHVSRFESPDAATARVDALVREAAALLCSHPQRRVALTVARNRVLRGDLHAAIECMDEYLAAEEMTGTELGVCSSFLRVGISIMAGNETAAAEASARLLALAAECPCAGLIAGDLEQLTRHLNTNAARLRLATIASQMEQRACAALAAPVLQKAAPKEEESSALSPRERDVFDLIARGMSRREISEVLRISESSVKCHQATLFRKLRAARRSDAIQQGKRLGLL